MEHGSGTGCSEPDAPIDFKECCGIGLSSVRRRRPRDCDLLGFSDDMTESGSDSLLDFYGAALVSAAENPSVNVYLFSDTCVAFAPSCEGSSFLNFVSVIFSRWLDDAMVPQGFVGYGRAVLSGIPMPTAHDWH